MSQQTPEEIAAELYSYIKVEFREADQRHYEHSCYRVTKRIAQAISAEREELAAVIVQRNQLAKIDVARVCEIEMSRQRVAEAVCAIQAITNEAVSLREKLAAVERERDDYKDVHKRAVMVGEAM